MLEDGMTAPAEAEMVEDADGSCIRLTIHEGRKRQIKRMCMAIGHRVTRLRRIQVGPIHLGDLPPGEFRYLSQEEIASLRSQ